MNMQLCWDCAKATRPDRGKNDTCEWATEKEPVPGWTAEKVVRDKGTKFEMISYMVTECPKFERDSYGGGMWSIEEYERRYSEKDGHHHPKRAGIPGREDHGNAGSALDHQSVGSMGDAGQG